jgi:hypothetical protein
MAAALLGAAVSAARAQDAKGIDDAQSKPSRWAPMFSSGADKDKLKPEDKAKVADASSATASIERTAKELRRHENALLRRMQVCDRLRQIAQDTNDEELERQADELEDLARAAYQRHAQRLGVGAVAEGARDKEPDKAAAAPKAKKPAQRPGEDKP